MMQALITGSGLLNTSAKSDVTQDPAPNRGSNTSPTRLQNPSSSYFGPQVDAGVAPSELPTELNFQHVVRGRSPISQLSQITESDEAVAASVLQPAAAKSSTRTGNVSTTATGNQGVKATGVHSQKLPTNAVPQNLEATLAANSSWQTLVSLSDNYDR